MRLTRIVSVMTITIVVYNWGKNKQKERASMYSLLVYDSLIDLIVNHQLNKIIAA